MTQEEFLKQYKGKFIEVQGGEFGVTAWMFEVDTADFSKGNQNFLGWIGAKHIVLGGKEVVEVYKEEKEPTEVILRPDDKIVVYESKEKLEARVLEYTKETLLKYENGN